MPDSRTPVTSAPPPLPLAPQGEPAVLAAALADRYRVGRALGAGGMATVYLARDLRHDRDVAIKVLHPELSAALGPERFLQEIALTVSLQHPHILPLFDSGEADGTLLLSLVDPQPNRLTLMLDWWTLLPERPR